MRHMRGFAYMAGCLAVLTVIFTGCKKNYYESSSMEEVTSAQKKQLVLDTARCELEMGMSRQISVTQWGYDEKPEMVFTSEDSSIASVDAAGRITAKAVGETVITADTEKQGFLPAECRIVVTPVKQAKIEDDIPIISAQNKSYYIYISFENCNDPSVRIIADCGQMTVEGGGEVNCYEAEPIVLHTSGQTSIEFLTKNERKNTIRILCYDGMEVIDTKEYIIYHEAAAEEYWKENIAEYIDGRLQ